jgi:hypothetical protein
MFLVTVVLNWVTQTAWVFLGTWAESQLIRPLRQFLRTPGYLDQVFSLGA